jgi:hypothetical protein
MKMKILISRISVIKKKIRTEVRKIISNCKIQRLVAITIGETQGSITK